MSAFVEDLTDLVATLGPLDGQDDNFSDGANALADALKAAEGSLFRIDQDAPGDGEAYVIRIEHSDGRRAKAILLTKQVPADGNQLAVFLSRMAEGLAVALLTGQGILQSDEIAPGVRAVSRPSRAGG